MNVSGASLFWVTAVMLLALAAPTSQVYAHEGAPISGVVIDPLCYVQYGGPSEDSKRYGDYVDCTKRGIGAGHPMVLKVEDEYYYIVDMGFQPMNSMLAPFVAKSITVHGHLLNADKVHVIAIEHLVTDKDKDEDQEPGAKAKPPAAPQNKLN